ncbi:hypothetical protein Bca4012_068027 [Brassica carinata]
MVTTRAVPALTEVVRQGSASELDGDEDADFSHTPRNGIKPAHTRTLNAAKNVSHFPNSSLFRLIIFIVAHVAG